METILQQCHRDEIVGNMLTQCLSVISLACFPAVTTGAKPGVTAVCNQLYSYWNSHTKGSHSVNCYLEEVTFPPLLQLKLVLDLATLELCKVELPSWLVTYRDGIPAR